MVDDLSGTDNSAASIRRSGAEVVLARDHGGRGRANAFGDLDGAIADFFTVEVFTPTTRSGCLPWGSIVTTIGKKVATEVIMTHVGVRELKNRASEIIRSVRDGGAEYTITVHGKPVAVLRPMDDFEVERMGSRRRSAALARMDARGQRVRAAWVSDQTAVELVEEQRRG